MAATVRLMMVYLLNQHLQLLQSYFPIFKTATITQTLIATFTCLVLSDINYY